MEKYFKKERSIPSNFNIDDLTECQKIAFNNFLIGDNIFITGPAGTGKTYLIKKLKEYCDFSHIDVAVTAMTGCAAYLIHGNTLHSWSGIGLGKSPISSIVKKIRTRPYLRTRWKNVKVLIIDEISMLDKELFEKLDDIAQNIRGNMLPWGGIQLCFFGDMCQLPPCNNKFIFESERWNSIIKNIVQLNEIKRQENKEFSQCLTEMRLGKISQKSKDILKHCSEKTWDSSSQIKPTRLYAYNKIVDKINNSELKKLLRDNPDDEHYTYECQTSFDVKNKKRFNKKKSIIVSEMMDNNSKYSKDITLTIGTQVMLIINLDLNEGLVNGSRGIVIGFKDGLPLVKFLHGLIKLIERYTWDREDTHFNVQKSQIPLKLAWACTIHKIQGATLDYAEIDINNVFEFGQAYVALSRIKDPESLIIKEYNLKKIKCHPKAVKFYKSLE